MPEVIYFLQLPTLHELFVSYVETLHSLSVIIFVERNVTPA